MKAIVEWTKETKRQIGGVVTAAGVGFPAKVWMNTAVSLERFGGSSLNRLDEIGFAKPTAWQ